MKTKTTIDYTRKRFKTDFKELAWGQKFLYQQFLYMKTSASCARSIYDATTLTLEENTKIEPVDIRVEVL